MHGVSEGDESFRRSYEAENETRSRSSLVGSENRNTSERSFVSEFSSPEAEIDFWKREVERLRDPQTTTTSPKLLETFLSLGSAYVENAQFEDAEPVLLRVREQMIKIWGWDHVCSQLAVESLRKVFVSRGDLDEAHQLYTEALKGVRRALGSEHPWTSQLQNNTACICIDKDDLSTAETLLRAAVRAKSTVFGPGHGNTLKSKCNLALVLSLLKRAFQQLLSL